MASQLNFLPPHAPIEFSLTQGTSIPSPPATPPKPEPITRLPSRPPTPGRGPLNSHPTTPVDLDNLPASPAASKPHTPTASPPPGIRSRKGNNLRNGSNDMFASTNSNFTTTVSSPATSQRPSIPQNKRSFLGLRRLSGAFDTNIRLSAEDSAAKNDDDTLASPRPLRPFSPVGGLISSFKPRSRTSSLNTGTTGTADDAPLGGSVRGLRKKKSASWFRRRMSGMPLGVGVETVAEGQVDGKGDSIDMDSVVDSGKDGFRHGGFVTDLEKSMMQEGEEDEEEVEARQNMTPPPQLPDFGMGLGHGHFAGDDSGIDLFGSIR